MAFNGNRKCKGNQEMMSCKISCPDSSEFISPPAEEYICYYSKGIFEPEPIPQCNIQSTWQTVITSLIINSVK